MSQLPLPNHGEVHLWMLHHEESQGDFLNRDEMNHAKSYRFESDRRRYLFTQNTKRQIIARYLGLSPESIKFSFNARGKPEVDGLEFSISHSKGLSVFVASDEEHLGVDIEKLVLQEELSALAQRIMTSKEHRAFTGLGEAEKLVAFYQIWTAKEAYLKCLGIGFEIEADQIETDFPALESAKATNKPEKYLHHYWPNQEACVCLATESPTSIIEIRSLQED